LRFWRSFMQARVVISAVMLVSQLFLAQTVGGGPLWIVWLCFGHLALTLAALLWSRPPPPGVLVRTQWPLTIGLDVAVFACLQFVQQSGLHYTPLFALPVLMASVLGPLVLGLGTAASVTLYLLGETWWSTVAWSDASTSRMLQAALTSIGFFFVAVLANQLAQRLAREETDAQANRLAARLQALVSDLVIEGLSEGVAVIDARLKLRSLNPAALTLLGWTSNDNPEGRSLDEVRGWAPLAELVRRTFESGEPQEDDQLLTEAPGGEQRLHVRTRLTAAQDSTDMRLCVLFMEDLREVEARIRTEKLASMGRLSAAVAHEIRNPLSAIAHANDLLGEDLVRPDQRRLVDMIAQNSQRLARIVEDVLDVARARSCDPSQMRLPGIALDSTVRAAVRDGLAPMGDPQRLRLDLQAGKAEVIFDPDQLRRVLINLLDNAWRHSPHSPGSVVVSTAAFRDGWRLSVWSAGPPIESSVRRHLFEPFFSSDSRSSGLGLFLCREMCERHGARISHQRQNMQGIDGNAFLIELRNAEASPIVGSSRSHPESLTS